MVSTWQGNPRPRREPTLLGWTLIGVGMLGLTVGAVLNRGDRPAPVPPRPPATIVIQEEDDADPGACVTIERDHLDRLICTVASTEDD